MRANEITNRAHGRSPGHPDYLIHNDAQLALVVIGTTDGKTQIANILGPAKSATKLRKKPQERSTYLPAIRRALKMSEPIMIKVDIPERVPIVEWISGLSDAEFKAFEQAYRNEIEKSERR